MATKVTKKTLPTQITTPTRQTKPTQKTLPTQITLPTGTEKTDRAQSFYADYNDPLELNSFADVILNNEAIKKASKNWGELSWLEKIPLIRNIAATVDLSYNKGIAPALAGEWMAVGTNTLMNFGETLDIVANPVKGLLMDGVDGFIDGLGVGTEGRKNYDWDTGNWVVDLGLEIISDPVNWFTFGTGMLAKTGAKVGGDALTEGATALMKGVTKELNQKLGQELAQTVSEYFTKALINTKHGVTKINRRTVQDLTTGILEKEAEKSFKRLTKKGIKTTYEQELASLILKRSADVKSLIIQETLNLLPATITTQKRVQITLILDKYISDTLQECYVDLATKQVQKTISKLYKTSKNFDDAIFKMALNTSGLGLGWKAGGVLLDPVKSFINNNVIIRKLRKYNYMTKDNVIQLSTYFEAKDTLNSSIKQAKTIAPEAVERNSEVFYKHFSNQLSQDIQAINEAITKHKDNPLTKTLVLDNYVQKRYGLTYAEYMTLLKDINTKEQGIYDIYLSSLEYFRQQEISEFKFQTIQGRAPKHFKNLFPKTAIDKSIKRVKTVTKEHASEIKVAKNMSDVLKVEAHQQMITMQKSQLAVHAQFLQNDIINSFSKNVALEQDGVGQIINNLRMNPAGLSSELTTALDVIYEGSYTAYQFETFADSLLAIAIPKDPSNISFLKATEDQFLKMLLLDTLFTFKGYTALELKTNINKILISWKQLVDVGLRSKKSQATKEMQEFVTSYMTQARILLERYINTVSQKAPGAYPFNFFNNIPTNNFINSLDIFKEHLKGAKYADIGNTIEVVHNTFIDSLSAIKTFNEDLPVWYSPLSTANTTTLSKLDLGTTLRETLASDLPSSFYITTKNIATTKHINKYFNFNDLHPAYDVLDITQASKCADYIATRSLKYTYIAGVDFLNQKGTSKFLDNVLHVLTGQSTYPWQAALYTALARNPELVFLNYIKITKETTIAEKIAILDYVFNILAKDKPELRTVLNTLFDSATHFRAEPNSLLEHVVKTAREKVTGRAPQQFVKPEVSQKYINYYKGALSDLKYLINNPKILEYPQVITDPSYIIRQADNIHFSDATENAIMQMRDFRRTNVLLDDLKTYNNSMLQHQKLPSLAQYDSHKLHILEHTKKEVVDWYQVEINKRFDDKLAQAYLETLGKYLDSDLTPFDKTAYEILQQVYTNKEVDKEDLLNLRKAITKFNKSSINTDNIFDNYLSLRRIYNTKQIRNLKNYWRRSSNSAALKQALLGDTLTKTEYDVLYKFYKDLGYILPTAPKQYFTEIPFELLPNCVKKPIYEEYINKLELPIHMLTAKEGFADMKRGTNYASVKAIAIYFTFFQQFADFAPEDYLQSLLKTVKHETVHNLLDRAKPKMQEKLIRGYVNRLSKIDPEFVESLKERLYILYKENYGLPETLPKSDVYPISILEEVMTFTVARDATIADVRKYAGKDFKITQEQLDTFVDQWYTNLTKTYQKNPNKFTTPYNRYWHNEDVLQIYKPYEKVVEFNKQIINATKAHEDAVTLNRLALDTDDFITELAYSRGYWVIDDPSELSMYTWRDYIKADGTLGVKGQALLDKGVYIDELSIPGKIIFVLDASQNDLNILADGRLVLNGTPISRTVRELPYTEFDSLGDDHLSKELQRWQQNLYELTGSSAYNTSGDIVDNTFMETFFNGLPADVVEEQITRAIELGKEPIAYWRGLPDGVLRIGYSLDELRNRGLLGSYRFNNTFTGNYHARVPLQVHSSNNIIINIKNSIEQATVYTKAKTEYILSIMDSDFSIATGVYKQYSDEAIYEALLRSQDQMVLAGLKQDEKYGLKLIEFPPINKDVIKFAREQQAILIPRTVFNTMYNVLNHRIGSAGFFKLWNRLLYLYKFGYLFNPGTIARNWLDTNLKTDIELGTEARHYKRMARDWIRQYKAINEAVVKSGKSPYIHLGAVEQFLKGNVYPTQRLGINIDFETYKLLDDFFRYGPVTDIAEDTRLLAQNLTDKDLWRSFTDCTGRLMNFANQTEEINRLAMYLGDLNKGALKHEAWQHISKVHFDYAFRTPVEQLFETVFPFSTFAMRNINYWVELMEMHPEMLFLFRDIYTPIWNFQDISQEELEASWALQSQIINGNINLFDINDTSYITRINPSLFDVFHTITNPIQFVQNKLAQPIKDMYSIVTGQEKPNIGMLPIVGTVQQRLNKAVSEKNFLPSLITKRKQYKPSIGSWSNPNLIDMTIQNTSNPYYVLPKLRTDTRVDPYKTIGIKAYTSRMMTAPKVKVDVNVYNDITYKYKVDVYGGIRYQLMLDVNKFR